MKKPRGGKREGAGRKTGGKNVATIAKEEAREAHRQVVLKWMERMTRAQVAAACGIEHFFLRDPTGKFQRVTDPKEIEAALNAEGATAGTHYWVFTKDPSTQAYTDLMNRALDKPKEQEQEVKVSGDEALVAALLAGRAYAAKKREDE